jgi:tRNA U34 5-methylaminomethyl-2-thiouridine-forming methyltransferase MnmC
MKKITSGDGSVTFFNETYGDIYHSTLGAAAEALVKYVKPAALEKRIQQPCIRILDVCFGLGYNTAAALDHLHELGYQGQIEVVCLENDIAILKEIGRIDAPFNSYPLIKRLATQNEAIEGSVRLTLLVADARQSVKECGQDFDAVFFDPFSPKKQPDLWQTSFFADIRKMMKKGAILTTYSCARMVRDNLKAAGFLVSDGPKYGTRSPATLAANP